MKSGNTTRGLILLATTLCMGCLDYSPYDGGTCASGKFEDDGRGVSESDEFLSPLDRNFTTDPIQSRGVSVDASSFEGCSVLVGSRFRIEDYEFYSLSGLTEVYGSLTLNVASFNGSVANDILTGLKNLRVVKSLTERPGSTSLRTLPAVEDGEPQLSQLTLNFAVTPPEDIIADLPSLKSVDRLTITGGDGLTNIEGFNALESVKEILITAPNLSSVSGFQSLATVESITVISQNSELGCLSGSLQRRWPSAKISALKEPGDTQPVRCNFLIKSNEDWAKIANAEGVADLTISGVTSGPSGDLSLKTITGNLTIQGTELTELSFLKNIESIGGRLTITNNPQLSTIEFPALIATGGGSGGLDGTLLIDSNSALQSVSLPALKSINESGSLTVANCMALGTLALPNIEFIGGQLTIRNNLPLTTIDLPRLMYTGEGAGAVSGTLLIDSNSALQSVSLPALKGVNGSLVVANCMTLASFTAPNLSEYDGFQMANTSVREIDFSNASAGGSNSAVRVVQNAQLRRVDLGGIGNASLVEVSRNERLNEFRAPKLVMIFSDDSSEGYLTFADNKALTTIDLTGLTFVTTHFTISQNDKLESLQGLNRINRVEGEVLVQGNATLASVLGLINLTSISGSISDNPSLDCEGIRILLISISNGMPEVRNNLDGCSL